MNKNKIVVIFIALAAAIAVLFIFIDNGVLNVHNEKYDPLANIDKNKDESNDKNNEVVVDKDNEKIEETEVEFDDFEDKKENEEESKDQNSNSNSENTDQNINDENSTNNDNVNSDAENNENKDEENDDINVNITFSNEICAGYYTVGKDIPEGTYDLDVLSGFGNVSSSKNSINEMMSAAASGDVKSEYTSLKLYNGDVLTIYGNLNISLKSKDASKDFKTSRTEEVSRSVMLKSGEYVAGIDFEAGVYNILGTKYSGSVYSSNAFKGGINEIMGTNDKNSVKEVKNVNLPKGTSINVDGTSVKLVPVK